MFLKRTNTDNRDKQVRKSTSFSLNYNKTHKSRLRYEVNYDLYKIRQENRKPKT